MANGLKKPTLKFFIFLTNLITLLQRCKDTYVRILQFLDEFNNFTVKEFDKLATGHRGARIGLSKLLRKYEKNVTSTNDAHIDLYERTHSSMVKNNTFISIRSFSFNRHLLLNENANIDAFSVCDVL